MYRHLIIALVVAVLGATAAQAGLAEFAGAWRNNDAETRGLTRLDITVAGSAVTVQAFGKAHPSDSDLGRIEGIPYAEGAGANLLTGAEAVSALWRHGFADRLVIIRPRGQAALAVEEFVHFTDASGRTNYRSTYTFVRERPAVTVRPEIGRIRTPRIPRLPEIKEDCISFNWRTAEVKQFGSTWKIVDGNHWMMDFGANVAEARQALAVIKHYHMNSLCYVGRPGPSMTYMLVDGKAPTGPMRGEDAVGFDPARLEVKEFSGRWKIVEGSHWIMDFEGKKDEADLALAIIRKHGFTQQCFVGRPDPSMTYFRK